MNEYDEDVPKAKPKTMAELMLANVPKPKEKTKARRGEHSPAHTLAIDLAEYFKEPKKVAFWLGIIKKYGTDLVYQKWKGLGDSIDPSSPRLLLFYLKKHGTKKSTSMEKDTPGNGG